MAGAPRRRALSGPAPEGSGEGAQLRVLQGSSDLTESHIGVFQKLACNLEADFVSHLSERKTFDTQVTMQGAAVHRKKASYCVGGTGSPEQFGTKNSTHITGN
jgi:hypothetical protein